MSRRAWLLSFLAAGAAIAACIVFALEIAGLDSKHRAHRLPQHRPPPEATVTEIPRKAASRVPIEPATVPSVDVPDTELRGESLAVSATAEPASQEWPPARAFTARCRAPGGGCLEGCTELAGGRCLDPCFIHTAECSRDCLKQDGTCGFPPPDTE